MKQQLETKNKTKWINTKEFIIIHHTATKENSIKWVITQLTVWPVSCHYIIDTNWDLYKIGKDDDILWHAWESSWWNKKMMNHYSIWIEVIWPLSDWWFTFEQRAWVKDLVRELMLKYNIPSQNVLRHADITPKRKVDIALTFLNDNNWKPKYKSWKEWQESL